MNATDKSKSWYWVFLVPLVFIAFFWLVDEMDIDEDVVIPAMIMTGIALLVILPSRYRHAKKYGYQHDISWFPWLFVAPAVLLGICVLIDGLNIAEELYIPAFMFTMVASIVVFRKKRAEFEPAEPSVEERVQHLLAAKMAEAGLTGNEKRKGPSWIWAVLIPVAGGTIIAVAAILSDYHSHSTQFAVAEAMAPQEVSPWPEAVVVAQRRDDEVRRQAERALRAAERQADLVERRLKRIQATVSTEQAEMLEEEKLKTKEQLAEAKQQLEEAKNMAQASLDQVRQQLKQRIEEQDIDVTVEGLTLDGGGVRLRTIYEGEPLVLQFDSEGFVIATTEEEASCESDEGDCETETILAECDEDYWEEQAGGKWSDIAAEIHRALYPDQHASHETDHQHVHTHNSTLDAMAPAAETAGFREKTRAEWMESADRPTPQWVVDGDDLSGSTHRLVVMTGPLETQQLCLEQRGPQLEASVAEYAKTYLEGGLRVPSQRLREFVADEYYGIHQSSTPGVGDRPVIYTLLEFNEDFREDLVQTYRHQSFARIRMAQAGIGSFGVLGLLATIFGYLKIDDRTHGQKRGRLQLGATSLLAVLALLCGIAFSLVPML